ncbi:MAG: FHA domain-containing protein [Proteobacteria bacterium]|nr:FHA domain-containing protein [Pseudomonadota bacterium]
MSGDGQRIWVVTPAQAEPAGLAALLGITLRVGLHVSGFVDSATITAAALGSVQNTIVLELGLHHVAATSVDCDGSQARRRRSVHTERGGLIELYQMWLDLVSSTMVKRTRFDPLHDAATEQQAFDSIPALALQAARVGSVTASISRGTGRFEADLTRDQFSEAAQPIYRSIVGLLHQLRPAGVPVAIVVPQLAAQLPGLREQLEQFVGCELVGVPDGFAAAATSLLDLPDAAAEATEVRLLRRLPVRPESMEAVESNVLNEVSRGRLGQRRASGPAPSHVLWDGRAYALQAGSLVVGRGQSSSRFITLPEGLAGVSRRHCTFAHDGDELVLLDHSTFGTFVNGERVQERVRIYAGDRVRLGEPGVELTLIAVGDGPQPDSQP